MSGHEILSFLITLLVVSLHLNEQTDLKSYLSWNKVGFYAFGIAPIC